jgi:capsular polysaccharide biosynthesis protein
VQLRSYLKLLTDHVGVLVGGVIVTVALAVVFTPHTAVYTARSTLYIGSRAISADPTSRDLTVDRVTALDRLTHTFAAMIASKPLAAQAIDRLRIDKSPAAVVRETTTVPLEQTQLLYVYIHDTSPVVARNLANALADSFTESVQQFEPGRSAPGEGATPTLPAYVFEHATLPSTADPTRLLTNVALAITLGLGIAVAWVLLVDHLDVTIRGAADAERRLKLPVLGVIPRYSPDRMAQVARGRWTPSREEATATGAATR